MKRSYRASEASMIRATRLLGKSGRWGVLTDVSGRRLNADDVMWDWVLTFTAPEVIAQMHRDVDEARRSCAAFAPPR